MSKRLGEILVAAGKIGEGDLARALEAQRGAGSRLGEILVRLRLIGEPDLLRALGIQFDLEAVDLKGLVPAPEALTAIPKSLAWKYRVLPLASDRKRVTVAVADPEDFEVIRTLAFACGKEVTPVLASRMEIREGMERYYGPGDSSTWEGDGLREESSSRTLDVAEHSIPEPFSGEDPERGARMPPVIRLADTILRRGIGAGASDIHLEPARDHLAVRLRVDGMLREEFRLPPRVHSPLLSRFKILARLDIAERRLPQDGTFQVRTEARNVDLRISTLPTRYGEKAALRILESSHRPVSLEDLGFSPGDHARVESLVQSRKGMILVTGPTGSGKTTTLYAVIQRIWSPQINIVTVEDPVEYNMQGVNQTQVRPEIGFGFARCLRAILRQDPDVILLGEIRDGETAEIAFRAAMTGHLVLTTLHTNDAVSTMARLLDLGIPKYVAASTVIGVMAQRLVRKVCPRCEGSSGRMGCPVCRGAGYSGRMGIFEVLRITEDLRERIVSGGAERSLREGAAAAGMRTLLDDGMAKVAEGRTTREEIRRVVDEREGGAHAQ